MMVHVMLQLRRRRLKYERLKSRRSLTRTGAVHYLNVLSGSAILNEEASRDERHELLEQWAEAAKVRRRTTRLPTQKAALHAGHHSDWHAAHRHPRSNFAAPGLLLIFNLLRLYIV